MNGTPAARWAGTQATGAEQVLFLPSVGRKDKPQERVGLHSYVLLGCARLRRNAAFHAGVCGGPRVTRVPAPKQSFRTDSTSLENTL